jgi:hypothetical protein
MTAAQTCLDCLPHTAAQPCFTTILSQFFDHDRTTYHRAFSHAASYSKNGQASILYTNVGEDDKLISYSLYLLWTIHGHLVYN